MELFLEKEQNYAMSRVNTFLRTKDTLSNKYFMLTETMSLKQINLGGQDPTLWNLLSRKAAILCEDLLDSARLNTGYIKEELFLYSDKILSKASASHPKRSRQVTFPTDAGGGTTGRK